MISKKFNYPFWNCLSFAEAPASIKPNDNVHIKSVEKIVDISARQQKNYEHESPTTSQSRLVLQFKPLDVERSKLNLMN